MAASPPRGCAARRDLAGPPWAAPARPPRTREEKAGGAFALVFSKQQREAGVECEDARQIPVFVSGAGVGQVVARLVGGRKEIRAHLAAQAEFLAQIEAQTAAHLADRPHLVAALEILALSPAGVGAEVD